MTIRIVPLQESSQRLVHSKDSVPRAAGIIAIDSVVLGPATPQSPVGRSNRICGLRAPLITVAADWLLSVAIAVPASAQISGDVVRIGILDDMSDPYADITGASSVIAAQMAAEDFGGAVLGHRIEVVSGDSQNKPDIGSVIIRRWYDEDGVDVVIGLGASSVALAVRAYA